MTNVNDIPFIDLQLSHYSKFERDVLHNALYVYSHLLEDIINTSKGVEKCDAIEESYVVDSFLFTLHRIRAQENGCDDDE